MSSDPNDQPTRSWATPGTGRGAGNSWKPRPPKAPKNGSLLGKLLLMGVLAALFILPFTGVGGKFKRGAIEVIRAAKEPRIVIQKEPGEVRTEIVEKEKIVYRDPPPAPLPTQTVTARNVSVADLFNGIRIQTRLQSEEGDIASRERKKEDAYLATFTVNIRVPKANSTLPELAAINPHLPKALPGLASMIPGAKVSGFYHRLYEIKQKAVEQNLTKLDKALSRHNFFDCETVLELEHPRTGQKVLLLQGEMDVVSDGSDGDRMQDFDDYIFKSQHFQATTSYSWKKRTTLPNPLIARFEAQIADTQKKLAATTSATQKKSLQGDIDYLKRTITSLKTTSFLIAQEDPFIVIPLSTRGYEETNAFTPKMGDYAVVASGNRLFPAIVGDYGPREKTGEASLRIAREINEKAGPYNRAESDLTISYFIFPGTAERPFSAPDYTKWHQKCAELVSRIGGIGDGYALHQWEDRLQKRRDEEAAQAAAAEAAARAAAEANLPPPPLPPGSTQPQASPAPASATPPASGAR